ncbi:MAG TPA: adenine phosphoribosyltransferase [Candidatus Binataceae bacterium]|jgi:adenine phosphoribosyltransferase|nr:adenine phosphoribosyltransferase [Candidatus Binataceae bacterium]
MFSAENLRRLIRDIPDFPQPGILFRDITPLLADPHGLAAVVDQVAEPWLGKVDRVLGIESRGFIIGAPVAYRLGVGLSIARKPGKLPFNTVAESYELEYGRAELHMHEDNLAGASRVLIVDDLLATGGTAMAAVRLAQKLGGEVAGCAFVIELKALRGRERLNPVPCTALVEYD